MRVYWQCVLCTEEEEPPPLSRWVACEQSAERDPLSSDKHLVYVARLLLLFLPLVPAAFFPEKRYVRSLISVFREKL